MKLSMMLEVNETFTTIWHSRSSKVRVKVRRWLQSPIGTIFVDRSNFGRVVDRSGSWSYRRRLVLTTSCFTPARMALCTSPSFYIEISSGFLPVYNTLPSLQELAPFNGVSGPLHFSPLFSMLAVCHSGSIVHHISKVTLRWAQLVLGWMTFFGQIYHLGKEPRQLCQLSLASLHGH